MKQIDDLIANIKTKPNWGSKELLLKIESVNNSINTVIKTNGNFEIVGSKIKTVSMVKKYDVLYLPLLGMPHYFLVSKVIVKNQPAPPPPEPLSVSQTILSNVEITTPVPKIKGAVYGVIFSSKDKEHSLHEIKKDRFFEKAFATSTYLSADLDESVKSFVRVFESKVEADEIFLKVKSHYKSMFGLK